MPSNMLKSTEERTWQGGVVWEMDVSKDQFVHFTTFERARQIVDAGKLMMNPPYAKFGGDAVYAVSAVWGDSVIGTQTTHIKGKNIVAIVFQTSTKPKYGFVEEVVWERDVILRNPKIVTKSKGLSLIRGANSVTGDDMVRYASKTRYDASPRFRRGQIFKTEAGSELALDRIHTHPADADYVDWVEFKIKSIAPVDSGPRAFFYERPKAGDKIKVYNQDLGLIGWPRVRYQPTINAASRVASKYKNKKQVDKADGSGKTTVYEYSKGQVDHRNREKAKRIEKLKRQISSLRTKVKSDLKSVDPKTKLTALAVALMDETCERVGNEESVKERGHFGITTLQAKHVKINGSTATLSYKGKSGVSHKKTVSDAATVKALKESLDGKSGSDMIMCEGDDCTVRASDVNDYLKEYDITAKDIRGFRANDEMVRQLEKHRKGKLPEDKKEREDKLKEEFEKALEATAEVVGHEPSTLKNQYLVPKLEDQYKGDGTVMKKWDKTAKNVPTNPALWDKVISLTKGETKSISHNGETVKGPNEGTGFQKYPTAYANGWASKVYGDLGGGWKEEEEETKEASIGNVLERVARGKAKKDVGHGGLDEWFSGHGGAKGKGENATWGDWVSISPVTKTLPSGKKVEKGDIVGDCGISSDADWKEETKGGKNPLKCMPRSKAHGMPKEERAQKAKTKQKAEKSTPNSKKPTHTPTFEKKAYSVARVFRSRTPFKGFHNVGQTGGGGPGKPEGLWYSCGSAWDDWCKSEYPGGIRESDYIYRVVIDPSKMMIIRNAKDFLAFEKRYLVKGVLDDEIDWKAVARDYDGIEICPYQRKFRMDHFWYYGWDVASGCIWGSGALKTVKEVGDSCKVATETPENEHWVKLANVVEDNHPSQIRVAARWVEANTAAFDDFEKAIADLQRMEKDNFITLSKGGRVSLRELNLAWLSLVQNGKKVCDRLMEERVVPKKLNKGFEMAYRLFSTARKMPSFTRRRGLDYIKFMAWWKKTEKRCELVVRGWKEWDEKSAGGEALFQLGSFTVHNVLGASGDELEGFKTALAKAERLIKSNANIAPGFSKVLYGEVFFVPQLQQARTIAWYSPSKDKVYVRKNRAQWGADEVHSIIHELGHRYWKGADRQRKQIWNAHHRRVGMQRVEIPDHEIGDKLPIRFRGAKRGWRPTVSRVDASNYYYYGPDGEREHSHSKRKINQLRGRNNAEFSSYPTTYSATSAEEHFCEAAAHNCMGNLSAGHQQRFEDIWGGNKLTSMSHPELAQYFSNTRVASRWLKA